MTLTEAYIREFEKFRQATPPTPKPAKPGAVQNVLTGVAPGTYTREGTDDMLTDDMLIEERAHPGGIGGVQRLYRLPNGFGLSLVNSPMLRSYSFAWEAAVVSGMEEDGSWSGIVYDTPLTDDVEVFYTDTEANDFIARAKSWAEAA